jgi:glutathionylspermidine synthase
MYSIKIGTIPGAEFYNYRLGVMFDAYKWDQQAGEQSTINDKVILLEQDESNTLIKTAIDLYRETILMEQVLKIRPDWVRYTGVSPTMTTALCNCDYQTDGHIRMMRFDFHPTTKGWQISEVNSDVPAGYPEASILPKLAQKYFDGYVPNGNFGDVITERLTALTPSGTTIAYLHDTHTVEDYQILHFIGDLMEKRGFKSLYADPSVLEWKDNKAVNIGAIFRYYPVEWLEYHNNTDWLGFVNAKTPSCNHPIALLTQSKRLPLVWDGLGVNISTWKNHLPETAEPTAFSKNNGFILKPAFGRVGEGINIPGTVSSAENDEIINAAKEYPEQWVAQKMFESKPFDGLHITLGIFVVDGLYAGMYGRASKSPRIDAEASEVPVLVKES